jgi:hypothetical protein
MAEQERACVVLVDARDWSEVLGMARISVLTDWWGGILSRPFRYALGRDATYLVYVSEVPKAAPAPTGLKNGAFVENLAEPETRADTAELFIMRSDGTYFEVHISPDGAWWYMDFSGYRTREPGNIPDGVEVKVERYTDSWLGLIRIPLDQLRLAPGGLVGFQATVALCSGPAPVYITSAGSLDFRPDFHDKRLFARLKL